MQRCQWHKRENVVRYLNESDKDAYRGKLQRAWALPTYEEAKAALLEIHSELQTLNRSAARSLMEGLEETLDAPPTGPVRGARAHLQDDEQHRERQRPAGPVPWQSEALDALRSAAALGGRQDPLGLLEVEQRMRRIDNYQALPKLRKALQQHVEHCQQAGSDRTLV